MKMSNRKKPEPKAAQEPKSEVKQEPQPETTQPATDIESGRKELQAKQLTDETSVETQQRFAEELEVFNMWEAKEELVVEQANTQFEEDGKVFDAAERAIRTTPAQAAAIAAMTDLDLGKEIVNARNVFCGSLAKAQAQARQRLIPLCEEMRKRYKRPGLKDRPFGLPTVDAYFRSIGLNYSTVRGWCAREKYSDRNKLRTAFFVTPEYRPPYPMIEGDNTPYARRGSDLEKIRKLANKIVAIAQGHDINLQPAATDLLIIASRKFATKYDADWLDPAAALKQPSSSLTAKAEAADTRKAA
jgi:hypothetical protein